MSQEVLFSDQIEKNSKIPILPSLLKTGDVYSMFLDPACGGVWMIDLNGITTYANESMACMLGYSKEEMIGKSSFSFLDEKARSLGQKRLEYRKQGYSGKATSCLKRKDGSYVWVLASSNPLCDSNGKIVGALAFVTDLPQTLQAPRVSEIACENLFMDLDAFEVRLDRKLVELTAFGFKLLKYFLENTNRLITRQELLEKVWEDVALDGRVIDAHIVSLRKKLKLFCGEIKTIYGAGYILKARV